MRYERNGACRTKRRYRSWNEAQDALTQIRRKDRKQKPVRVYDCPQCHGYHLTSKPEQDPRPVGPQRKGRWTAGDEARFERLKQMRGTA